LGARQQGRVGMARSAVVTSAGSAGDQLEAAKSKLAMLEMLLFCFHDEPVSATRLLLPSKRSDENEA